jgi:ubiquinone/menaquinone biosynthesis C-methylase UbiE
MIDGARRFNRFGKRVTYHVNDQDDLRLFDDDSFDFVMSLIVLQHMPNRYKTSYIKEFLRILKPGGVVTFTIPSHVVLSTPLGLAYAVVPNRALNVYRKRHYGYEGVIELHPMRRKEVEATVVAAGARLVAADREPLAGDCWRSFQYIVVKPTTASRQAT